MKALFVHISKAALNGIYRLRCATSKRRNTVVFLSRQANKPSYDFEQIAHEFANAGWEVHFHVMQVTPAHALSYLAHVLRELSLLAQCRVVILDRYDPIVSLLNFTCEDTDLADVSDVDTNTPLHHEFPTQPVIIQLWHAFGAFKKFGYASAGTPEAHSLATFQTFAIHRNYSWVLCSGAQCRHAFAQAFAYPQDRVLAYRRPTYTKLLALQDTTNSAPAAVANILMAPTRRINEQSPHPFRALYEHASALQQRLEGHGCSAELTWAFHPLDEGLPAVGNVNETLESADVVITDYSSIAYEAYLLHKPVLFFVPDIEQYRQSPGLFADPMQTVPALCATTEEELAQRIATCCAQPDEAYRQLEDFAAPAFSTDDNTVKSLLELIEADPYIESSPHRYEESDR